MIFFSKKITALLIFTVLFCCFIFLLPSVSHAQLVPASKECAGHSGNCGNYELNDFVIVFINGTNIILGLVGSLALLFFVYGGVMMIISAGSSEKIESAKTILRNAVIGLFIVFLSWNIINFVYYGLGGSDKSWYQLPGEKTPEDIGFEEGFY